MAFFPEIECFDFKQTLSSAERLAWLEACYMARTLAILILTLAVCGSRINLNCVDNLIM